MEDIDLLLKQSIGKFVAISFGEYKANDETEEGYSEILLFGVIKTIKGRWVGIEEKPKAPLKNVNIDHIQYFIIDSYPVKSISKVEHLQVKKVKKNGGNNIEI
jgi:hypothetical protein